MRRTLAVIGATLAIIGVTSAPAQANGNGWCPHPSYCGISLVADSNEVAVEGITLEP